MWEVGERSLIRVECGIFDFQDLPAEGRRQKVEIGKKVKVRIWSFDSRVLHWRAERWNAESRNKDRAFVI